MLRRRALHFLILATLVAGAAGCGGSSDEQSVEISTSDISKVDFVEQVNAICTPARPRLLSAVLAYQEKHLNELSQKVVPNAARKVIRPEVERQIEAIRELGAPSGDAQEIESFFASLENGIDRIIKRKATTFAEAEGMLQPAVVKARRYGLDECRYVLSDEEFNTQVLNSG